MRSLRPILIIALLLLLSVALGACERERPPVTPVATSATAAPRNTVAPSPTPPIALTQVTLPGATGAESGQATPVPATAVTPAAPTPIPVVISPGGQAGETSGGQTFTYTVVAGDSLSAIAQRFGVSVETLVQLNNISDPNTLVLGQQLKIPGTAPAATGGTAPGTTGGATTAGGTTTYIVQAGDTLSAIARRFGTTVQELVRLNNLANPDLLSLGQQLIVPATGAAPATGGTAGSGQGQTYIVQSGDTLLSIARRFGVTVAQLQAANNIANPDRIYPGQVLVIP